MGLLGAPWRVAQAVAGAALVGGETALELGRAAGGVVSASLTAAAAGTAADTLAATQSVAGALGEAVGAPPVRRCSTTGNARWVEVRGLADGGQALADAVVTALRDVPGVTGVHINGPTGRAVVTVGRRGPSERALVDAVVAAEAAAGPRNARTRPVSLPGDDAIMASRLTGAILSSTGLGAALAGGVLPLRLVPKLLTAPFTVADYHPRVRRLIEDRLGVEGADLAFAAVATTSATLAASPSTMVAGTLTRAMQAAEALNGRRAWRQMEPMLTELAAKSGDVLTARQGREGLRARTGARYAEASVDVGLGVAGLLGLTAGAATAAEATQVAAPRAVRTVRESFSCAIGRGLHARGGLVLHSQALRWLAEIDTVVFDPRILYTDQLTVSRVRGVARTERSAAWTAAARALEDGLLSPGWNPMSGIPGGHPPRGEALVSAVRDPLAAALITEARRAGARVISLADDGLHSLRQGFDELHPPGHSVEDTLAAMVAELRSHGSTVALLSQGGDAAALEADVAIGVLRSGTAPPWGADLLVPDLAAAWRMMRTIPMARDAANKGRSISAGSSVLGALMLIPTVAGSGPASVDLTAAAGLWAGFNQGRKVFDEPLPQPEPGHDWYAMPAAEVARLLPPPKDDDSAGDGRLAMLAQSVPGRLLGSGWQALRDYAEAIREDLSDPITPILATGAAASALLGSPLDAVMVASVLVVNSGISAQQTVHAAHVLNRLLAVQEPLARRFVVPARAGNASTETEEVTSTRLRPGDLIEVRAGEVVPADARLVEADGVEVDESALTGESLPVTKNTEETPGVTMAERSGMLFAGTTMVAGRAVAIVTAAGPATAVRRALAMSPQRSGDVGLSAQLRRITRRALPWSLAGGGLVGALSLLRGTPVHEAASGTVSVAVAAVPEGLPLVVTLAQSASARRLSSSSVLIRNPKAIEAFARLEAVCFDKTGTLSENHLKVTSVRTLDGVSDDEVVAAAAQTMIIDGTRRTAHATDQAVQEAAEERGLHPGAFDAFLPFQSDRPFAAALTGRRLVAKGAPERLLPAIDGTQAQRQHLETVLDEMAAEGLRVLAVAERTVSAADAAAARSNAAAFEALCNSELVPLGLLGLADTPRPGSRPLLEELQRRGIAVKLITGDHPVTAQVIASQLGMGVTSEEVLTGTSWEAMTAPERRQAAQRYRVFARMAPEHKVEVVQALEAAGQVTAMVGDGANDAAAIRAASVGVGVVSAGSDPARMAADVMLLGGQIGALVEALDEGEQLWRRVQSAVSMLLGHNTGEVIFGLITSALMGRPALNARQMLLVNMLTDALPAAAVAVSPQLRSDDEVAHDEATIWRAVAVRGVFTTLGGTLAWALALPVGSPARASTVGLIGLVLTQMMQTLSDSHGPLVVATNLSTVTMMAGIISTPGVSQVFGCTPVGPIGWGQAAAAALAAGAVTKALPGVMDHLAGKLQTSVFDGEDADTQQDGVNVFDDGSEQSNTSVDQGIRTHVTHDFAHTTDVNPE
nr:cation-translocating P-type ATPase [Mycolicibacterium palauense]